MVKCFFIERYLQLAYSVTLDLATHHWFYIHICMYCEVNAFINGKKNLEPWTSKLVNDLLEVVELVRGELGSA